MNYDLIRLHFAYFFSPQTLEDCWGIDHLVLFSAAIVELAKSIPVHSLILSSHLFFSLPLLLFLLIVLCRIVFAKPEDFQTWPNHLSVCFLTRVGSSSHSLMAAWIFLQTSSLVSNGNMVLVRNIQKPLVHVASHLKGLLSFLLSVVKVHDSQANRIWECQESASVHL